MHKKIFGHIASALLTMGAALATPTAGAVELRVYEWEGYILPWRDMFEQYARWKGVDVSLVPYQDPTGKPGYIGNSEDIYTALKEGKVDVVTPTNNYYKAENAKMMEYLMPIDPAQVPNLVDLPDTLRNPVFAQNGNDFYAVPLLGGTYALAYQADRLASAPTSWAALLEPAMKGKITVTGDQYEANIYTMALLAGAKPEDVYDIKKIDRAAVQGKLNALVANTGSFWGGMPSIKQMEDSDLATDYMFGMALARQKGQNWKLDEPKEGQTVWLDNISIAKAVAADPEKVKAAHLLIDFMISPEMQSEVQRLYGVVVVNPKARPLLPSDDAMAQRAGDTTFFKKEYFWQPLSVETRAAYRQMWDEAVKAAGKAIH